MAVRSDEFFRVVDALVGVERAEGGRFTVFLVRGKRFGYYWPRTRTVGLKQTVSEQLALVIATLTSPGSGRTGPPSGTFSRWRRWESIRWSGGGPPTRGESTNSLAQR